MKHALDPFHGYTKSGIAVHKTTADHMPVETAYQRFNKKTALWLTKNVFTMTCFWVFCFFSLLVIPSVLFAMGIIHTKMFLTTFGFELLMTWMLSTFIQLVLLPAIGVGQNLQSSASDARSEKQFNDTEDIAADIKLIKAKLDIK
jgi:hypothetical protein